MNTSFLPLTATVAIVCPAFANATPAVAESREELLAGYLALFTKNLQLLEGIQDKSQFLKAQSEINDLLTKLQATDAKLEADVPVKSTEKMNKAWEDMFKLMREKRPAVLELNARLSKVNYFDSEKLLDSAGQLLKDVNMVRVRDLIEAVDPFVMGYFTKPQEEKAGEILKKEAELIDLTKDFGAIPGKIGFYSELFKKNPQKLAEWFADAKDMPVLSRQVFLTALTLADTEEAKKEAKAIISMDPSSEHMVKNIDQELLSPKSLEKTDNPAALDLAWGAFFASGDPDYIHSLVRCAVRPDRKDDEDVTRAAARWSLKAIGKNHARVKELADAYLKTRSKEEQEIFTRENPKKDSLEYSPSQSGAKTEDGAPVTS